MTTLNTGTYEQSRQSVIRRLMRAELIASIQRGIDQSHAGQTRPAREVLAELGIDPDDES